MKFLIQFLIIIAFSFAGELLHYCLPLPIPASIYGIILLFLALELKVLKVKDIRETSSFLIAVMPVMFIPAAVGLIDSWHAIANAWLQYIVVTVVSTFVVMAASGWITQFVIRRRKMKVASADADKGKEAQK
nr:CidA/LrgA family protein [uncultured Prevotella sp.]